MRATVRPDTFFEIGKAIIFFCMIITGLAGSGERAREKERKFLCILIKFWRTINITLQCVTALLCCCYNRILFAALRLLLNEGGSRVHREENSFETWIKK